MMNAISYAHVDWYCFHSRSREELLDPKNPNICTNKSFGWKYPLDKKSTYVFRYRFLCAVYARVWGRRLKPRNQYRVFWYMLGMPRRIMWNSLPDTDCQWLAFVTVMWLDFNVIFFLLFALRKGAIWIAWFKATFNKSGNKIHYLHRNLN